MASTPGKIKATFELTAAAKHKLATLKADVRLRLGSTVKARSVSEAAIVEALIQSANVDKLAEAIELQK
uniref:Uncharacterized protein n=1 Tax=mine drainage metagenome TaxID=410659 RepID=E6PEQ1_9ZZZZ